MSLFGLGKKEPAAGSSTSAEQAVESLYEYFWPRLHNLPELVEKNIKLTLDEELTIAARGKTDAQEIVKMAKGLLIKSLKENSFRPLFIDKWDKMVECRTGKRPVPLPDIAQITFILDYDFKDSLVPVMAEVRKALNKIGSIIANSDKKVDQDTDISVWTLNLKKDLRKAIDHDLKPASEKAAKVFGHLRYAY